MFSIFSKDVYSKSSLDKSGIQERVQYLIDVGSSTGDRFTGKVKNSFFVLSPILGTRENFKITIYGTIKCQTETEVIVTYKINNLMQITIYIVLLINILVFLFIKYNNINIQFGSFDNGEYLILGGMPIFILMLKLFFNQQYYYYSKLVQQSLYLI